MRLYELGGTNENEWKGKSGEWGKGEEPHALMPLCLSYYTSKGKRYMNFYLYRTRILDRVSGPVVSFQWSFQWSFGCSF
jgi:hypothetical protein